MKVAVDTGSLSSGHAVRGIGVMVREQVAAFEQESKGAGKKVKISAVDFTKEDLSRHDVVHYPYFFPYSLTLPSEKVAKKVVVTIQDLIHLVYPKAYPPGIRGRINLFKQKQRLNYVDAIVTISETSKKDIVRFLGVDSKKVRVIYLAPKKIFKKYEKRNTRNEIREKYSLPEEFVLYVGDVNYNKNIPNLIKACEITKAPLVIVGKQALELKEQEMNIRNLQGPRDFLRFLFGKPHPELAHYEELLKYFGRGFTPGESSPPSQARLRNTPGVLNSIIRPGFVPDEDLVAIYNLASVYCQPSYYEGFGFPVLEAMACGTPVVVSRTNALVEIAGGAALIADPNDPKDFADKFRRVFKDTSLRKELVKKGRERAKQFSWKKNAKETIELYKEVYGAR